MKTYIITYHMSPAKDITIEYRANSEDDAIIFAKNYRNDSFSIELKEMIK